MKFKELAPFTDYAAVFSLLPPMHRKLVFFIPCVSRGICSVTCLKSQSPIFVSASLVKGGQILNMVSSSLALLKALKLHASNLRCLSCLYSVK
jgi:hypothetical protein